MNNDVRLGLSRSERMTYSSDMSSSSTSLPNHVFAFGGIATPVFTFGGVARGSQGDLLNKTPLSQPCEEVMWKHWFKHVHFGADEEAVIEFHESKEKHRMQGGKTLPGHNYDLLHTLRKRFPDLENNKKYQQMDYSDAGKALVGRVESDRHFKPDGNQ